jgi:hypothetical protein
MRFYALTNMYLSSIQNGIQPLHVLGEMFTKYTVESPQKSALFDWAENHKTVIVLNGGTTDDLIYAGEIIAQSGMPYASFYEPGISKALTSIGVIVPELCYNNKVDDVSVPIESIFDYIARKSIIENEFTEEELALMELLQSLPLAK